ncbi:MAG: tRNA 2-selenouridine(34) synthase MnmH [Saprospiraceae bacterium]|nr:tRNA 2-selenouridine(34) synthase MnmH [Saprospiraceae bacterium]
MAIQILTTEDFLLRSQNCLVLDVRSPGEFEHAHLPGAKSIPLFSDDERAVVGTVYKQNSREAAIKTGLDYFGPKMKEIIEEVEKLLKTGLFKDRQSVFVYCWRGGMRSAGVAWLLDLYGFKVHTMKGGYKSFRNWTLTQFEKKYPFRLIGGYTGSGKTFLLHQLIHKGYRVIDLEGLASHKGSAFGNIGMPDQPSQEMFENILAWELFKKSDTNESIWMEDESQRIGAVNIPGSLWRTMLTSPVFFMEIPFEERLNFIVEEYGNLDRTRLTDAVFRIKKRLGGLEMQNAVNYLATGDIKDAFRILLKYYDKFYHKSLHKKPNWPDQVKQILCDEVNAAQHLLTIIEQYSLKSNV